MGVVLS